MCGAERTLNEWAYLFGVAPTKLYKRVHDVRKTTEDGNGKR
jgi:hypothetical protein